MIIRLTDMERLEAEEQARAVILRAIGEQPSFDDFRDDDAGEYPPGVARVVALLLGLAALGAAVPSFLRLFTAGRDYYLKSFSVATDDIAVQAALVGLSTFLLAEFLVVLSTVAASVFYHGRARLVFAAPIVMGLSVALVGNITIVRPDDAFSWLEAVVPVLAVLFLSLVGERMILASIRARHAQRAHYLRALTEWRRARANPQQHPDWERVITSSVKRKLLEVNSRGAGAQQRRALLEQLTREQWRELVRAELLDLDWPPPAPAAAGGQGFLAALDGPSSAGAALAAGAASSHASPNGARVRRPASSGSGGSRTRAVDDDGVADV